MSRALSIEPRIRGMVSYLRDIEQGLIQIPSFQRNYLWKRNDILDLFDSIKRGYPIGSIILWKPESYMDGNFQSIGSFHIPQDVKDYTYILDGFQRLSSLFGCLTNPNRSQLQKDESKRKKEYNLYYDLEKQEFFFPTIKTSLPEPFQIPVYALVDTIEFRQYTRREFGKILDEGKINIYLERADELSKSLLDYQIASIDIKNASIEEAVEIFSRINSKGSEISKDWIVSALTNRDGFRLGTEIDMLIEDLRIYNYHEIKRDVIFLCIQNSFGRVYFDTKIEELAKRKDFIAVTRKTVSNIKKAVAFLFEELLVINNKILPYNMQLVFITDFFNKIELPSQEQLTELKKWFWITSYSSYFTIYSLSNQRRAYNQFQKFLKGEEENSVFNERPEMPFSVPELPDKIYFGSVRAKALLLYLLNYANGFNRVEHNKVEGLDIEYLFYDLKDEKGNSYPETVVPFIRYIGQEYKKTKDASYLFEEYTASNNINYLISEEMVQLYFKDPIDKNKIKELRGKLLFNAEKEFANSLGLEYIENSGISE